MSLIPLCIYGLFKHEKGARIFSEIELPLDFNENMRKLLFKKSFSFEVIYSICYTEEIQISKFPIYCMI